MMISFIIILHKKKEKQTFNDFLYKRNRFFFLIYE
jgi:hypothetical protein